MIIHKEGYRTIAVCTIVFAVINLASFYFISYYSPVLSWVIFFGTLGLLLFLISFFRVPSRIHSIGEKYIVCPTSTYRQGYTKQPRVLVVK